MLERFREHAASLLRNGYQAVGIAIERDGRVFLSPAVIDGEVWLRPCFTNFRTRPEDVDVMLAVISELSERLARDG